MSSLLSDRAAQDGLQVRSFPITDFEFRDEGPTGFTFEGVASTVGVPYPVRDQFGEYEETIAPGAYNKTLRDGSASQALYVNHGWRWGQVPLATRDAKTLDLVADPHLRVRAFMDPLRPDVQIVRSAVTRGELPQMSVGYQPVTARDKWSADGQSVVRGEVRLMEVSIVHAGANKQTSAAMRSFDVFMESLTDLDMGESEIRRALAYFESLLPSEERTEDTIDEAESPADFSVRDGLLRDRLARRLEALAS